MLEVVGVPLAEALVKSSPSFPLELCSPENGNTRTEGIMMVKAMRSDASTMSGLILFMIVPPVCKILEPAQTCRIASQLHTYGGGQAFITDILAVNVMEMVTGTNMVINTMIKLPNVDLPVTKV